jgi:tRNA uridine 5-carbamoylmethylation protein Kti12
MPKLNIFRGLPGSGKTTAANKMGTIVLSAADMYSMKDGVYKWTPENSQMGREWALEILQFCVLHEIDVTIAEVLPTVNSVMRYASIALDKGYDINVVDCEISIEQSLERNTHNVPIDDIKKMAELWERWEITNIEGVLDV